MATVVLAGASGTLGRHLAPALKSEGHAVHALTRHRRTGRSDHIDAWYSADAYRNEGLNEAFRHADAVISCVGASVAPNPMSGWRSYTDVDVSANTNLIHAAARHSLKRFVYVGVAGHKHLEKLGYVQAHEAVVSRLRSSGLSWSVVRATGFFSSFEVFLSMAQRGHAFIVGDGNARTNPIHESDLAEVCVRALDSEWDEISVGGPEILTRRSIVELAFSTLAKKLKITSIPALLPKIAAYPMAMAHPRMSQLTRFLSTVSVTDVVAELRGKRKIGDHFKQVLGR